MAWWCDRVIVIVVVVVVIVVVVVVVAVVEEDGVLVREVSQGKGQTVPGKWVKPRFWKSRFTHFCVYLKGRCST